MVSVRAALESLWKDSCSVYIKSEVKDPVTKITKLEDSILHQNKPCKLSFETILSTVDNSNAASPTQKIKLFISPDIEIPAGSKIVVTRNGKTTDYERSGEPAIFTNHQEITLELFKGWA